jgi:hypothetical protein
MKKKIVLEPKFTQQAHTVVENAPTQLMQTDEEFAFWLAGSIDGDGYINPYGRISICYHSRDKDVAHAVQLRIGHGKVSPVKNKNAVTYYCGNLMGRIIIANLIQHKLVNPVKIEQFNTRLAPRVGLALTKPATVRLDNHWLAGFVQADGSFQIKTYGETNPLRRKEVRLNMQIDLKTNFILNQARKLFGGYIGYRKSQDTYYYGSTSFKAAQKWIAYLDRYQVTGPSWQLYLLWRKCYMLTQDKQRPFEERFAEVKQLKQQMTQLRTVQLAQPHPK